MAERVSLDAEALSKQVDSFQAFQWKKHRNASILSILFTTLGVCLSGAVTAAAFLEYSTVAGVLGIGVTLLIGLHEAFNFSERAAFFASIHSEAKAVRDRLRYRVKSESDFNEVFDEFQALRLKSAQQAPMNRPGFRGGLNS
ncbi:hypothetical protein NJF44_10840 [Pseudomonas guariconensis]|uniref:hypothetical protein n=1 Tax=Pseudomonas TaxID=286 RepID=UPI00209829F2|nr:MULTISPECIES: hypothetical protein [Pseudomonas]MCO7640781.1 hypothetical protein [Pseudomonas sp. S 311-6]MCO7515682.1 hypothetical protein [Pseudomonas putida]MCO7566475.1 hypothetical protein [Pseudomonas mosselii]MCO7605725.1 hypothetical protein [Pseudomonas guariconensis]MCO7617503.1 hypothetical protein [Pseudomonas guariconensis]